MGTDASKINQLTLETPVQFLPGVGPHRAEIMAQLGIHTLEDLLEYYPRNHEFLPELSLVAEVQPGWQVTLAGVIDRMRYNARSRPPRMDVHLEDNSGTCRLIWFNGRYLRDKFRPGDRIAAWGRVSTYRGTMQLVNPAWMRIRDIDELTERQGHGCGIYRACADMSSLEIGRIIRRSLDNAVQLLPEWYDKQYRKDRRLCSRGQAIRWIHMPPDAEHVKQARRRLIYDELFLMELAVALRRYKLHSQQMAYRITTNPDIDKRIRRLFGFELTDDQNRVISAITADMDKTQPMNRLLQGDVGSGKTVVALYAALLAVSRHRQVAIMAPTEILAQQHYLSVAKYLKNSKVKYALLTGGMVGGARAELLKKISDGQIDIVVGTQALLQGDVQFRQLALVVIDEQHKFGVRQRELIRGKDLAPHYLVMTATPIPRTLSMTVYGDLDVSTIKQLPKGRGKVSTHWVRPEKRKAAYEFIRQKVKQGQQVYFVYPRVEKQVVTDGDEDSYDDARRGYSDYSDAHNSANEIKTAVAEYERLKTSVFPELNVGLLHGKMDKTLKQQVMDDFRAGKIQILVTTVVIEVGLDVPDATIMVIEHAERFGLTQLHQLRGRIGRGTKHREAWCLLFGKAVTEQALERLETMVKCSDGFSIAEQDLRLRGPGEFFGTAQHGLPELKIADLVRDMGLLQMARRDAFDMVKKDPKLENNTYHKLLKMLVYKKFCENIGLVDVG